MAKPQRRSVEGPDTNLTDLFKREPAAALPESDNLGGLQRATRENARAARKREYDQGRNRKMIDLPRDLEEMVKHTARELGVPESQVLVYWAIVGAGAVTTDEMKEHLKSTRSMRYAFTLDLPDLPTVGR